jgi:hypothetical protein
VIVTAEVSGASLADSEQRYGMSTPILRRATENQGGSEWRELPDGVYRWIVGRPTIQKSEQFQNLNVNFPLTLTEDEKKRVADDYGDPPEGTLQSWRPAFGGYRCGLSLGYVQRDGSYKSTKLVDFFCSLFGATNATKAREWIAAGGGPLLDGEESESIQIQQLESWFGWCEGLELLGSIKGEPGKQQGDRLARFGGPMPIGTSGTTWGKDPEYQALGLGKLRAIMASTDSGHVEVSAAEIGVAAGAEVAARYNGQGEPLNESADEDEEEAALKAQLAEKQRERLAAKAEGARQPEPAGVGAKEAPARTYNDLFPKPEDSGQ